ncbi:hypothetical protein BH11BAC1_BH11BAC1_15290 [soil metagenome]
MKQYRSFQQFRQAVMQKDMDMNGRNLKFNRNKQQINGENPLRHVVDFIKNIKSFIF